MRYRVLFDAPLSGGNLKYNIKKKVSKQNTMFTENLERYLFVSYLFIHLIYFSDFELIILFVLFEQTI